MSYRFILEIFHHFCCFWLIFVLAIVDMVGFLDLCFDNSLLVSSNGADVLTLYPETLLNSFIRPKI